MNTRRLLPAIFAAALVIAQNPPTEQKCAIAGRVVSAATGQPLAKARVQLQSIPPRAGPQSVDVDAAGRFWFRNLDPGRYRLSAVRRGYSRAEYGARRSGSQGAIITLQAGQMLGGFDVRLPAQAVITGRVVDADGDPVTDATVFAMQPRWDEFSRMRQLDAIESTSTNDLGEFRIWSLAPGRYYLRASRTSSDRGGPDFGSQPAGEPEVSYAPVYYPGEADPSRAEPLDAAPGAVLRGIDLHLLNTRVYRIRGRVLNAAGNAAPGASVSLSPAGAGFAAWDEAQDRPADEQGNFEFHDVRPGWYWIEASAVRGSEESALAALAVEVAGQNVSGVALTLAPGIEITGSARMEGNEKPNWREARMWLKPVELYRSHQAFSCPIRDNGTFVIASVPPAHYRLAATCGEGCYLKSAFLGDQDAAGTVLDFTQGAPASGALRMVLSTRVAEVSGVVRDGNGQSVAGAAVALLPSRREDPDRYSQVESDQYGHYEFKSLPPGAYKLLALEELDLADLHDPNFMKPFESSATPVTLEEGGRESVDLVMVLPKPAQ